MRILHVITRLILGGAQQNTVMSCKAQVEAGHEVHLAFGPIHGPEGSLLHQAKASGATLHEIKPLVRPLNPLLDWRCYREICKLVGELSPDLVHSHSSKAGILARHAAWKVGWKMRAEEIAMHRVSGTPPKELSLPAFSDRDLPPPRPIVIHTVHGLPFHEKQAEWRNRIYVELEKYAAKHSHHLIAITPAMVDAFVEHNIAPAEKFTVIPSGIDVAAFMPRPESRAAVRQELGIPADAMVVGHIGRLDPLKGHTDLLDQLSKLQEAGAATSGGVWLLFVGDGFHRKTLEAHPSMKMGKTVMTGLVDWDRVPGYLSAMDVMALPSYQEGQSRTLCEALLCGVPVVGYDVGGIPSVCIDGVTGRLVPVGDKPALGRALIELLENPQERQRLAAAGRDHVVEHFGAAKMNRELLELYERLIGH